MPAMSFPVAIDAVVKASLILAVAALAAASLRRASASARHLVWMLGLISALAVPALATVTPRWELPIVNMTPAAPTPFVSATMNRHLPKGGGDLAPQAGSSPTSQSYVAPSPSSPLTPRTPSPAAVALTLWAIG